MSKADIAALLERVRQATGPDRELDIEFAKVAGLFKEVWDEERQTNVALEYDEGHWREVGSEGQHSFDAELYTASLDAIVALIDSHKHKYGRKVICGFFAGGQLMADQSVPDDPDYDPRARPDNSVTVGWAAHVAFYKPCTGSESYGPEGYSHARTAALALCAAFLAAKLSLSDHAQT